MLNDNSLRKILIKTYKLTPAEERLYFTIREIYFFWGDERSCYASTETLVEETNMSSSTVKRSLKVLEEKNLIKMAYEKTKGFLSKRNIYPLEDELLLMDARSILDERTNLNEKRNEVYEVHDEVQNETRTTFNMNNHAVQNEHINNQSLNNYNLNNTIIDIPEVQIGADAPVKASFDHALINSTDKQAKEDLISEVIRRWNEEVASVFNLAKVVKVTPKRKKSIKLVIETVGSVDNWILGIKSQLTCSPFHRGKNDRKWKADFDYYLRTEKALKALEGAMSPQVSFEDSNDEEGYVDKTIRRIFENYNGDKQDLIF